MKTKQDTTQYAQARKAKHTMIEVNPDSFLDEDDYEIDCMQYLASLPVRGQYEVEEPMYYV